jgi:phosphoribosylformylglycinamidine synthase
LEEKTVCLGSYNELDVPPTLCTFCIGVADTKKVVSNEFKKAGSNVLILKTKIEEDFLPDFEDLKENYEIINKLISSGKVLAVSSVRQYGIADAIFKMSIGNKIGFEFTSDINIFNPLFGSFIVEVDETEKLDGKFEVLGNTVPKKQIVLNSKESLDLEELIKLWEEPLEEIFPTKVKEQENKKIENILSDKTCNIVAKNKFASPRIFIPAFPGTNCEYDKAKAFSDYGGTPNIVVFRNLKENDVKDSIIAFEKAIKEAQIIVIPGGFSAGDEPDGSAKFIRNSI